MTLLGLVCLATLAMVGSFCKPTANLPIEQLPGESMGHPIVFSPSLTERAASATPKSPTAAYSTAQNNAEHPCVTELVIVAPAAVILSDTPAIAQSVQPINEQRSEESIAVEQRSAFRQSVTPQARHVRPQQPLALPEAISSSNSSANNAIVGKSPSIQAEHQVPTKRIRFREWTDDTARFRVTAILLGFSSNKVRLRRLDGKQVDVPLEKLSESDRSYLRHVGVSAEPRNSVIGRVIAITDANHVMLLDESNQLCRIRLEALDAPENRQAFGPQARQAVADKILRKIVRVEWSESDEYGHRIGNIFLDDRWINYELIEEGWAWHDKTYSHRYLLVDAEELARLRRDGLWSDVIPIPPGAYVHQVTPPPLEKLPSKRPDTPVAQRTRLSKTSRSHALPPISWSAAKTVHVSGYHRKDGTYVRPHTRRPPSR